MKYPSNDDGRDRQRMEAGDLAPLIAEFTRELSQEGYTDLTVRGYDDAARHLAHWLAKSGIATAEIEEAVVRRFSRHRCRCPGMRREKQLSGRYVRRACRFVAFLANRGIAPQKTTPAASAPDRRAVEFQDWLRRHRGLSERTIELQGYLLMQMLPALRPQPRSWDAQHIREVIIDKTKRASRVHVKKLASTLRGYVRFLGSGPATSSRYASAISIGAGPP